MYKRLSIVMFPILLLALIGTGVWGYLEHQEKNSVLIKAENQYQRAFHDLSYHMDKLHTQLGQTLAVNSASQDAYRKGLVNVWRITSEAQSEIAQLPLGLMPFSKTEEFLANLSEFSYRTAVRDMTKQPLDEKEVKTLHTLYGHSKQLADDLRKVQSGVMANNLRWMDVELALATKNEPFDNTIIDGFKTMDKKVSEYPEINWSPTAMTMFQKRDAKLLGEEVTAGEIRKRAARFLGLGNNTKHMEVVENGPGTEFQSYSVTVPSGQDAVYLDFSKNGGHLLWLSHPRDVTSKKLNLRQARDAAAQFLDERGYGNMSAINYDEYNNVAHMTFASNKNDVINYLEKVSVLVALDNGEITGLEATDYAFSKRDRELKAPVLTESEAKKALNPNFEIQSVHKALIRNELDQEVQCYQFIGRVNGGLYRVFVNADTGVEEMIETIRSEEARVSA